MPAARTEIKYRPENSVFLNCPFDASYKPIFDAMVFAVFDTGFVPRCALEFDDGTEIRLSKILRIIGQCNYGIHDISYTALDPRSNLPRFNMPFELGIFIGCKQFGRAPHVKKVGLVLDREPYRYQQFLSDLAGHDIRAHGGDPRLAIHAVREWLRIASRNRYIPGGEEIWQRYNRFRCQLPHICRMRSIRLEDLTFVDYAEIVRYWLQETRRAPNQWPQESTGLRSRPASRGA
jgi:hypothetical protein